MSGWFVVVVHRALANKQTLDNTRVNSLCRKPEVNNVFDAQFTCIRCYKKIQKETFVFVPMRTMRCTSSGRPKTNRAISPSSSCLLAFLHCCSLVACTSSLCCWCCLLRCCCIILGEITEPTKHKVDFEHNATQMRKKAKKFSFFSKASLVLQHSPFDQLKQRLLEHLAPNAREIGEVRDVAKTRRIQVVYVQRDP